MIQAGDAVMARLHCLMVTALFKAALQPQSQPGTIHAALHAHVHLCKPVHRTSPIVRYCAGSEAKLTFLKSSHDVLQPAVLSFFSASSAAIGQAASSMLLPAMVAVAEQLGLACRTQFAGALWKATR